MIHRQARSSVDCPQGGSIVVDTVNSTQTTNVIDIAYHGCRYDNHNAIDGTVRFAITVDTSNPMALGDDRHDLHPPRRLDRELQRPLRLRERGHLDHGGRHRPRVAAAKSREAGSIHPGLVIARRSEHSLAILEPTSQAAPVRLRVTYKNPVALLGEFTRSVGKGVVALESAHKLPVGTRFVFELHTSSVAEPVEVFGEIVQVKEPRPGKYLLAVRYDPGSDRRSVDAVLQQIYDAHSTERARKFPRIPLSVRATEDGTQSSYIVRNLSRGGVGLEVEATHLPPAVKVGTPFLLELWLSLGTLLLHGEIVWISAPPGDHSRWVNPSFGVIFGKLRPETLERLEEILRLRGLPPPPWRAKVSFGMDAVSRMP